MCIRDSSSSPVGKTDADNKELKQVGNPKDMKNPLSHLDISEMTTDQKIKILQIGLQYLIPRLKHVHDEKEMYEPPLFLTE